MNGPAITLARATLVVTLIFAGHGVKAQGATPSPDAFDPGAMLKLARARNCVTCHAIDRTLLAPSYRDIAKRYAGDPNAADVLSHSITEGSRGKWGSIPMPAGLQLAPGEARLLATWILGFAR